MKKITILLSFLFLCSCKGNDLTPKEQELVKKLNFDTELMILVKNETANELTQLPAIDGETGEISNKLFDGISSKTLNDDNYTIVKKLKDKFKEKGYLIFTFIDDKDEPKIAVIKGTNELDIVRYRRTDGINYNLENIDVVTKLENWKSKNDLNILVCGRDWLQFEFKTMPTDLDAFAKDAYKFCPDIVDQGVGDINNLKGAIKEMNGLYLWWD
jgi:hypothetical protein